MNVAQYIKKLELLNYSKDTIRMYKWILESSLKVEELPFEEIIKRIIRDELKASSQTFHKKVFQSYLKFCKRYDEIEIVKELQEKRENKNTFREVLTREEIIEKTELTGYLKEDTFRTIIRFIFETGIRISEVNKITQDDKKLYVMGKGNKRREIFFNPETYSNLLKFKWMYKKEINIQAIRRKIKALFGDKYACHSLRRSFATHMFKNNADPKIIMKLLGHNDINTTFRYLQKSRDEELETYKKLFFQY
ncbi:tyrosine-type recombinase/integrase [Mesomycoplasma molare]|uniref:Tyrosine-type recombinase/integrase n=1 Tax=Mesomycoplasma molare TaxID=171288 RepID=A0ABY5TYD0_9BACT|nr:tyrosine-type recombinase/integrase [Mesomycoplasma molare]UWD34044.1 tyrosine-type recombinase/integrase [Mesomycoplasma molare]